MGERPAVSERSRLGIWAAAFVARPLPPSANGSAPARHTGPPFTLLASNVACGRCDPDATAVDLVGRGADILCAVEHTPTTRRSLMMTAGLRDRYPYVLDDAHASFFGSLVATRFPVVDARVVDAGGRRALVVDLEVEGQPLRVVPVHVQAPVRRRDLSPWQDGIAELGRLATAAPGAAVLAGDWNATPGNGAFRRVLRDHALVDAHRHLGRAWPRTWPSDGRFKRVPVPLSLGLDHVVVTPDVTLDGLDEHHVPGTDHLALQATLSL